MSSGVGSSTKDTAATQLRRSHEEAARLSELTPRLVNNSGRRVGESAGSNPEFEEFYNQKATLHAPEPLRNPQAQSAQSRPLQDLSAASAAAGRRGQKAKASAPSADDLVREFQSFSIAGAPPKPLSSQEKAHILTVVDESFAAFEPVLDQLAVHLHEFSEPELHATVAHDFVGDAPAIILSKIGARYFELPEDVRHGILNNVVDGNGGMGTDHAETKNYEHKLTEFFRKSKFIEKADPDEKAMMISAIGINNDFYLEDLVEEDSGLALSKDKKKALYDNEIWQHAFNGGYRVDKDGPQFLTRKGLQEVARLTNDFAEPLHTDPGQQDRILTNLLKNWADSARKRADISPESAEFAQVLGFKPTKSKL